MNVLDYVAKTSIIHIATGSPRVVARRASPTSEECHCRPPNVRPWGPTRLPRTPRRSSPPSIREVACSATCAACLRHNSVAQGT